VIGQFNLGFIIGKLDQDLFIVDQVTSTIFFGTTDSAVSSTDP
jgi:DNA mismatch repair ATPase MutL